MRYAVCGMNDKNNPTHRSGSPLFSPEDPEHGFISGPSATNRRKFLKRSGGATMGTALGWSLAANNVHAVENSDVDSDSKIIELDSASPGDGANSTGTGAEEKHGWNWKSKKITVEGSFHLLILRWKCVPHPKHPSDLVGTKKDKWDFTIEVLAQIRKGVTTPPSPRPSTVEEYMIYEGLYYQDLLADAGWSTTAGSNGTVSLSVTKVNDKCKFGHNPVDDDEEFYNSGTERHKLILAVRNDKPNGSIATSQNFTVAMLATVVKEEPQQADSQFEVKYTPPANISFTLKENTPAQDVKTTKLGEVKTSMGLGFTVVDK